MKDIAILNLQMYNVLFYFIIYAFLGWCLEVVYNTVNTGTFVNRGFLNGPVCPIYGFGMILIIFLLKSVENNLFLLFLGSVVLASMLEYITGYLLEKIFYHRWWDYSDKPFNISGYICLKFSLAWGVFCIFVIKIIHPTVSDIVKLVPILIGNIILAITVICFIIDIIATIDTVLKLNVRLEKIHKISAKIKQRSDSLGSNISRDTIKLKEKYEKESFEFKQKYNTHSIDIRRRYENDLIEIKNKYKKELSQLTGKYVILTAKRSIFQRRLIKAFPDIRSVRHFQALEILKKAAKKNK